MVIFYTEEAEANPNKENLPNIFFFFSFLYTGN